MRVRHTGGAAYPTGGSASDTTAASVRAVGAAIPAAAAARAPGDVATIAGISEAELTPRVRTAVDRLMAEILSLREGLGHAQQRVLRLEQLADRDPLAPVLNRRAFVRELTRMIAFAERYGAPGSVVYFDIDGMKRINDTWGHGAGDAALRHVGEVLVAEVRASDVVGRLGGDEFAVVLAQADPGTAAVKAGALAAAIKARPATWQRRRLEAEVSYGVFTFTGGEAVDEALSAADRAMYHHKREARRAVG